MNAHRMDQETVERLLVGPAADRPDGPEALVRLLTAVRVAPRPHELTGEPAALAAFRAARAGSLPAPAARPERRILAGLLGAKVAVAALLAAAATGGVALAAATGNLPGSQGDNTQATTAPSTSAGLDPSPTGGSDVSPTPGAGPAGRGTASPAILGLCTAYRAEESDNRRRALENSRFADLVSAAGGREKVPDYCDRLLDAGAEPATARPSATDRPGHEPTGRATNQPERSPATPPVTEVPTARATGASLKPPAPTGSAPR
ncbi:hypothetical protein GCM10023176_09310 [Micromonospora coerulea]|uniref:Ankyrin repeat protein n=1 Tax=Micromonospora coerulea TaxID=47856 RepID=A0ABP8SA26_9ACTN